MAIEGLKRIFDIHAIKKGTEKKFPPKGKKGQKKYDKDEKKDGSKIDIQV
jgi:hypothetical protein